MAGKISAFTIVSAQLYDFLCRYTSRTLAARARTITRMNANEGQGQVFSETTNRGRAEGKSWIVVCTSCSSCTLDFGVIHLVGRCVLTLVR